MKKEAKIVLPFYKIGYAISVAVILSLIRGVTHTYEIGIAIEAPFAILTVVFCADTYVQEIVSRRSEVHRLYPIKKRVSSMLMRILLQGIFLLLLAVISYGLFFVFQKPVTHPVTGSEQIQFAAYLFAIAITIFFWEMAVNLLAIVCRNIWMGIGGCLLLWITTNSSGGEKLLGAWNVFSYTFRKVENPFDFTWIYGKILCVCIGMIFVAVLPKVIRKRG